VVRLSTVCPKIPTSTGATTTCGTPPSGSAAYLSGVCNGGDEGEGEGDDDDDDDDDDESEGKPENNNDPPRERLIARGGFAMRISGGSGRP
jgi:hypothetical protein